MATEITFIPDRLNEEPVIFIGMTDSELKMSTGVSLALWLPVSILIAMMFGHGILGVAGGALMAFLSMWLLGKKLREIKRGRPKGFHVMAIAAWLEDNHLKPKTMIRESRTWDITRVKQRR